MTIQAERQKLWDEFGVLCRKQTELENDLRSTQIAIDAKRREMDLLCRRAEQEGTPCTHKKADGSDATEFTYGGFWCPYCCKPMPAPQERG